jgi:hypothetical protein
MSIIIDSHKNNYLKNGLYKTKHPELMAIQGVFK